MLSASKELTNAACARLLCVAALAVLAACGNVTARGDEDADAAIPQPDSAAEGADAGTDAAADVTIPRVVRVLHRAGDGDTTLYATDIRDDVVGDAKPLSPAGARSIAVSRDGTVALYKDGAGVNLVRIGNDGPSTPVRISGSHGSGSVGRVILKSSGAAAFYSWDVAGPLGPYAIQFYFVDLSKGTPGAPVPLANSASGVGVAALSANDAKFLFQEGSSGSVYVVDVTGSVPGTAMKISGTVPTDRSVSFYNPTLSPTGERAAFISDVLTQGVFELFVVDTSKAIPGPREKASGALVAGGAVKIADESFFVRPLVFSPDGKRLTYVADAFTADVDELFVVDVSGSVPGSPRRVNAPLTSGGDVVLGTSPMVQFSPTGKHIAYYADQDTDDTFELFLVDVSASIPGPSRRLNGSLISNGDVFVYEFAPEGSGIAYVADQRADGVLELFYVDLRQATPSAASTVNGSMVTGGDVYCAALVADSCALATALFSGDGRRLAYAADQDVNDRVELYVADVSSGVPSKAERVQESSNPKSAVSSLIFASDHASLLWRSNSTGEKPDLWFASVRTSKPGPVAKINGVSSVAEFVVAP